MQPKPIAQYCLYYSYSDVPFDNCDADWMLFQSGLSSLKNAKAIMNEFHGKAYWIVMKEVTKREIVYSEVDYV